MAAGQLGRSCVPTLSRPLITLLRGQRVLIRSQAHHYGPVASAVPVRGKLTQYTSKHSGSLMCETAAIMSSGWSPYSKFGESQGMKWKRRNHQSAPRRVTPGVTTCEVKSSSPPSAASAILSCPATLCRQLSKLYDTNLARRPLTTKSVVIACGLAIGDVIAQLISWGAWNPVRTAHMFSFGMVFQGPALHVFYRLLDSRVYPDNPKCPRAVVAKTAADQLILAPIGTVAFFTFMELVKGNPAGVAAAVSAGFLPTLKASYMIWPAAHLVNFRFCPPDKRVLFVNVVSIAWSTVLSLLSIFVSKSSGM